MTRENDLHPAMHWRTNEVRLKFVGSRCPDCGNLSFTMRGVCHCGSELYRRFEGKGAVTAVWEAADNEERFFEVTYTKGNDQKKVVFGLNGLSHRVKVEINMSARIFSRKSSKKEAPELYYELTSLSSK